MNEAQLNALNELEEIVSELRELGEHAQNLTAEFFPDVMAAAVAYEVFDFGSSGNPYDTTFETVVKNIARRAQNRGNRK
jgi:hypothetical protein